jgi:hypothetical protein
MRRGYFARQGRQASVATGTEINHFNMEYDNKPDTIVLINAHGGAGNIRNTINLPPNMIVGSPWDAHDRSTTLRSEANPYIYFDWTNLLHRFNKNDNEDHPTWHFYKNNFPDKGIDVGDVFDDIIWFSEDRRVPNQFNYYFKQHISDEVRVNNNSCSLSDVIQTIVDNDNYNSSEKTLILVCTCDTNTGGTYSIVINKDMSIQNFEDFTNPNTLLPIISLGTLSLIASAFYMFTSK